MSFRKVRHLGLGLIIAILILVGLIPTFVTQQIRGHNATFLSKMQELEMATNLQKNFWRASTEFHDLVHRSEENFDSIINQLAGAIGISRILEKKLNQQDSDGEVAALKKLQRHTKIFKVAVIQYKNEFNIDPSADNTAQLELIALDAQKQTNEAFSRFIAEVTNDVKINQIAIDQTMKSSQIFSIIGLIMGVLAGIFVAIYIGRALNEPIQRLVKGTERVAQGELSFQIDETESDEIGRLASAFNKMSANLLIYIDKQKKLARIAEEAAKSEKNKSQELVAANSQLEHEIAVRKVIEDILENSLVMIKEKALKHGIKITTDLDDIPESINSDERKLKQILYNLLSNAVKFTPEHGSILLTAKRNCNADQRIQNLPVSAKNYLQISVQDSGIGIEKKDLERIFDPFEQVENSAGR